MKEKEIKTDADYTDGQTRRGADMFDITVIAGTVHGIHQYLAGQTAMKRIRRPVYTIPDSVTEKLKNGVNDIYTVAFLPPFKGTGQG